MIGKPWERDAGNWRTRMQERNRRDTRRKVKVALTIAGLALGGVAGLVGLAYMVVSVARAAWGP